MNAITDYGTCLCVEEVVYPFKISCTKAYNDSQLYRYRRQGRHPGRSHRPLDPFPD